MIEDITFATKEMSNIEINTMTIIPRPRTVISITLDDYDTFIEECEGLIEEELKEQEPNGSTLIENILDILSNDGVSIQ